MDDQEALAVVNHEVPLEKLQSLVRQGNTTSFIFSVKNRVGGLAKALKVFQVNFNKRIKTNNCFFFVF
jgi:prephenate dehydratase